MEQKEEKKNSMVVEIDCDDIDTKRVKEVSLQCLLLMKMSGTTHNENLMICEMMLKAFATLKHEEKSYS